MCLIVITAKVSIQQGLLPVSILIFVENYELVSFKEPTRMHNWF